ncbi:hypothetical protein ACFQJD_05270 [Haloplanus sp. GCM10025708]|uniref:DUF7524 family protein n=1 Tax=Haloferacaceae TaxID=1644056 RepID=UPI00362209DE
MPPSLSVELNRGSIHEVDAPAEFHVAGPFTIRLRNHGEAIHVHLNLDDDLSSAAALDSGGNYFVEGESETAVDVDVRSVDQSVRGKLKVVTAYGNETAYVDVVVDPEDDDPSVDVDENLSRPPQPEPRPDPLTTRIARRLPARRTLPVLTFALVAVGIAAATAFSVESQVVTLGVGVVVLGVFLALIFLWK